MLLRFLTFLLMLGLVWPSGVFGAAGHRCGMGDRPSVATSSCCRGMEQALPAAGGLAQLTHPCQIEVISVPQVAAVNVKTQIDTGIQLKTHPAPPAFLRLITQNIRSFSMPPSPRARGEGVPVFLRTCTFLI